LTAKGYANGIIFRAFGDGTIGLAPALCCNHEEMELLLARLRRTLDQVLDEPEVRSALRTT
jgi:adenosylmethionine-8-amino-7-oxononanoate aminotransferase